LPRITQPSVEEFIATLQGTRIIEARRRGKQLYFPLENGSNLLVHLGMTGRLHVEAASDEFDSESLHKHIHGVLVFDDGRRLVFTDPRTFGALGVARELPFLQAMAPEPLDDDFDEEALARKLSTRKTKLKAALLDQKLVAVWEIFTPTKCAS
jgi:formamidopyrimidine-DNA glycosylase